jgi:hypothetical protein
VLAALDERRGPASDAQLSGDFDRIYRAGVEDDILDVRPAEQKRRLFGYKEEVWTRFHYSQDYLRKMESQSFWDAEYEKIAAVDFALAEARASL